MGIYLLIVIDILYLFFLPYNRENQPKLVTIKVAHHSATPAPILCAWAGAPAPAHNPRTYARGISLYLSTFYGIPSWLMQCNSTAVLLYRSLQRSISETFAQDIAMGTLQGVRPNVLMEVGAIHITLPYASIHLGTFATFRVVILFVYHIFFCFNSLCTSSAASRTRW